MSIVSITTDVAGQIFVNPRRVKIIATDNLATVTAAGYLNAANLMGYKLYPTDVIDMIYSYVASSNSGTYAVFTVAIASTTGVITLTQWTNPGDVAGPIVSGDFANFTGTTGQITDLGFSPSDASKSKVIMAAAATVANHIMVSTDTAGTAGNLTGTAINDGSIQAGRSGIAGTLISFPSAATSGSLAIIAVASGGNFAAVISNKSLGQATTWSLADPGTATANILNGGGSLVSGNFPQLSGTSGLIVDSGIPVNTLAKSTIVSPDAQSDLIWYDVTATAAALATAGKVNIQVSSGAKQYKVRDVKVNYAAAGLSGGGGDRLLSISDSTTVYNNAGITAALLGTPINTLWGGSGNPVAGTVAQNTSTAAGANLFLQYIGGTTDYTTGQIVVSVLVQRVA